MENLASVAIANPMSGLQVTCTHDSSPKSVRQAKPIRFWSVLHSFEFSIGPCVWHMISSDFLGIGAVGRDFTSALSGSIHLCDCMTQSMYPGQLISTYCLV